MKRNETRARQAIEGLDGSIEITFHISPGLVRDIMTTAIEGGINYWADVSEVITTPVPVARGLKADTYEESLRVEYEPIGFSVVDVEDPIHGQKLDVTATTIVEGIKLILGTRIGRKVEIAPAIANWVRNAVVEDDASEIDVVAADCIVQVGLFGEIVYG